MGKIYKLLKCRSGNPYAKSTVRTLLSLLLLDSKDVRKAVDHMMGAATSDSIAFYWALLNKLACAWVEWEVKCRRGSGGSECEIPAADQGPATYYSSSIKRVILRACEDHSTLWLIPYWVRWYALRLKDESFFSKLKDLSLPDQLVRLADYPVLVAGFEAIARTYLVYAERVGDFAYAAASYIYWDIINPLYDTMIMGMEPFKSDVEPLLKSLKDKVSRAASRHIETEGLERMQLIVLAEEALEGVRRVLAEYLLESLEALEADEGLRRRVQEAVLEL